MARYADGRRKDSQMPADDMNFRTISGSTNSSLRVIAVQDRSSFPPSTRGPSKANQDVTPIPQNRASRASRIPSHLG